MVKVAGAISKSGEVMKSMNDLMKIGAMQEGMRNLAREMMRAGLIEEMVDDAMEGVGAALLPALMRVVCAGRFALSSGRAGCFAPGQQARLMAVAGRVGRVAEC